MFIRVKGCITIPLVNVSKNRIEQNVRLLLNTYRYTAATDVQSLPTDATDTKANAPAGFKPDARLGFPTPD